MAVVPLPVAALQSALGSVPAPELCCLHGTLALRSSMPRLCDLHFLEEIFFPVTFKTDFSFSFSPELQMLLHVYFSPALLCAFLIEGKANLFLGTGRWMFETAHKYFHLFIFAISKTHIRSFAKPYKSLLVPLWKKFEISSHREGGQAQRRIFFLQAVYLKHFPPFFFRADLPCSDFIVYACIKHLSMRTYT